MTILIVDFSATVAAMCSPEWASLKLFKKALQQCCNSDDLEILGYSLKLAVSTGENYATDMFRATVCYNTNKSTQIRKISLMVKSISTTDCNKEDLAKELMMFEKEIFMFENILPKFEKINAQVTFAPKYFYSTYIPNSLIILEDLSFSGFKMADRHFGLDLDHCFMVVDYIAAFHATSLVAIEKNPKMTHNFKNGLFFDGNVSRSFIATSFESLIRAANNWPGYEKYAQKIKNLTAEELMKRSLKSVQKGKFNVLNHGDLWMNNILFAYSSSGKVEDIRFVDYQPCVHTSPAIDLHYFLATSASLDVLQEHLDSIIEFYYSRLLSNLTKLQYDVKNVPEKPEFLEDFKNRSFYGLLASASVLPLVKADRRPDASFGHLMEDTDFKGFRNHCYMNERYKKHMEYLLPYFDNCGTIN